MSKRPLFGLGYLSILTFCFSKTSTMVHGESGFCRILEFTPPLDGHALVDHVIRTISLDRQDACRVACYLDNDCLSYNFGRRPDGDYICQLSDSDHYQHPYDLKKSSDFIYRGTENACSENLCSAHGKCKVNSKDNSYYCQCEQGFAGKYCDEATKPTEALTPTSKSLQSLTLATTTPLPVTKPPETTSTSKPLQSPATTTLLPGSGPCEKYTVLDSVDRSVGYSKQNQIHCDRRDISKGWYRFMGAAGNMMPTSCVPMNRCGTYAHGWLKSRHPTLYQGIVIGQVCYHWQDICCRWENNIRIKNCGTYFVYELVKANACNLRYCGDGPGS